MIKDTDFWKRWETGLIKKTPVDFRRNLELVEAMYAEARSLGRFNESARPGNLEAQIRVARAVGV